MKDAISICRLDKETAGAVGELFRTVYGEGYPMAYVYNPQELWSENESGNTHSVLAVNAQNKAVGHLAIFRSAPNPKVYELGQLLVIPQYRGSGIGDQLTQYVTEELVKDVDIDAIFCESVCNHTVSQKTVAQRGYVDTALEVDLMPAQAYQKEQSSTGRVACILQFKEKKTKSQQVFLPACYHKELTFFYDGLSARDMQSTGSFLPTEGETTGQEKIFDFAGVAKIAVERIGADFSAYVSALEKLAEKQKLQVTQVYLPLNEPAIGAAVSILHEHGFFLGGILPYWFGGDGLLMQKLWCTSPDFAACQLYTVKAGQVLNFIRADWERSKR